MSQFFDMLKKCCCSKLMWQHKSLGLNCNNLMCKIMAQALLAHCSQLFFSSQKVLYFYTVALFSSIEKKTKQTIIFLSFSCLFIT